MYCLSLLVASPWLIYSCRCAIKRHQSISQCFDYLLSAHHAVGMVIHTWEDDLAFELEYVYMKYEILFVSVGLGFMVIMVLT